MQEERQKFESIPKEEITFDICYKRRNKWYKELREERMKDIRSEMS